MQPGETAAVHALLLSGHENGMIRIYGTASGRELASVARHDSAITVLQRHPNGRYLLSFDEMGDNRVYVWDLDALVE